MNVFQTLRGVLFLLGVFVISLMAVSFSQAAAPLGSSSLPDLTHLSGYAYDPDLGNLPSEVHIYIDNVLFDSTIADFSLPSLVSQGITPNPEHAFFSLLPSNLSPGDHTIKVTTLDEPEHTEVELIGSPHIIHVPDPNGNPPPQGGGGGGGGAADLSPDPFIISPITDVRVSTQVISNANTLTGFAESLNIIITANNQNPNVQGGSTTTILKNGVDTGSTAVLVSPGDAVSFKTKSSPTLNTQITLDITLGTYTTQWSVTTALLPPAANPQCTEGSQTFTSPGTSDYTILAPGCTGITIETQGAGKNPKISTFTGAIPPTSPTYSVTVGSTAAPISSVKYQSTTLTTSSGGTPDPLFQNGKVTISWKGSPQFQSSPQNVTQLLQRVTPPAPPAPVPPQLALPTIIYHHPDHLTSTSIDTDQTGTITQLNDYYPFGSTRISTTTGDYHNDYLYTGKEQDDATNLMYYGARYYDATTGRFLALDPASLNSPEQFLQDPQQLNTYSYARNNPLIFNDPSGEKVSLVSHSIFGVGSHSWILAEPDNPNDFFGQTKFTLGAYPDTNNPFTNKLQKEINNEGDYSPTNQTDSFEITDTSMSDTELIQNILGAYDRYNDDRGYWFSGKSIASPGGEEAYIGNSNNFVHGLIEGAGIEFKSSDWNPKGWNPGLDNDLPEMRLPIGPELPGNSRLQNNIQNGLQKLRDATSDKDNSGITTNHSTQ